MIRAIGKKGFTLIELMVVVAMIALIIGAMTAAVRGASERSRIQKATAEVRAITQAVLSYENYAQGHKLPEQQSYTKVDASSVGFLLGKAGTSETGTQIPTLLLAALSSGGEMLDPWGKPYQIKIIQGTVSSPSIDTIKTGFMVPNFYHLTKEERE